MGENLHGLVEKKSIAAITFMDCSLVPPKDITPPHFMEKAFTNRHKTLMFTKVFSLESFPYTILVYGI